MDKLSSRVTKMQSDNQMRFSDLENTDLNENTKKKKAKLPGTSEQKILVQHLVTLQAIFLKSKKPFL